VAGAVVVAGRGDPAMTGGAVLKAALAGASRRLVQTVVVFVVLAMATTATLATITIGLTSTMGAGRLAAIRNGAYLRMVSGRRGCRRRLGGVRQSAHAGTARGAAGGGRISG
jgi:hypothetical protein